MSMTNHESFSQTLDRAHDRARTLRERGLTTRAIAERITREFPTLEPSDVRRVAWPRQTLCGSTFYTTSFEAMAKFGRFGKRWLSDDQLYEMGDK
jgi:hypothetical protein